MGCRLWCHQSRSPESPSNYNQFYSASRFLGTCIILTRVHISDLNSEGLLANVDMGPPVLSLWGWTEGEPRGRLLCSGVLGKGQCTQLRSGGKCKTNMPHTCFPLSCYGSAFKDPPPPSIHTALCLSLGSLSQCPPAQSFSPHPKGPRHGRTVNPGRLFNYHHVEAVQRGVVCQDRRGRPSSGRVHVDCSSAQRTQTCWHSVAQVHTTHTTTHWCSLFCVIKLHYSRTETSAVRSSPSRTCRHTQTVHATLHTNNIKIISCMLRNSIPEWGSHHLRPPLILLKSGNQYRSTHMRSTRCCCVHVHFSCMQNGLKC